MILNTTLFTYNYITYLIFFMQIPFCISLFIFLFLIYAIDQINKNNFRILITLMLIN
jgi:hypothetical protein